MSKSFFSQKKKFFWSNFFSGEKYVSRLYDKSGPKTICANGTLSQHKHCPTPRNLDLASFIQCGLQIWKAFQKKGCNCWILNKKRGPSPQSDSQTTLSIKPWSMDITWGRKKIWSKNIFFLGEKWFWKFYLKNSIFLLKKSKFSFFFKIKIIFSIFFQNHFSP